MNLGKICATHSENRIKSKCKGCNTEKSAKWRLRHPGEASKASKTYFKNNKEKIYTRRKLWRDKHPEIQAERAYWSRLNWMYSLSKEDYFNILKRQNNKCAICKKDAKRSLHGKLFIDHDHTLNFVRGLLCNDCNLIIGHALDSKTILCAAINYLKSNIHA